MPDEVPIERHQLLADIAEWYYIDGMSQHEIARRVDLSRPSISRLLLDAREAGIVEIKVHRPIPTVLELERELESRFSLQQARVLERRTATDEEALRILGRLGVTVLSNVLEDGMTFGLAWGTTVHAVIEALSPQRLPNVKVVQLIGGVGAPYRSIDAPEQCRRAAQMFGAQHYYLNAPMRVENPEVAAALREDHSIREVLELAQLTNVALVGIGPIISELSTQYHSGYISYDDLRSLDKLGAVGTICASNYDILGQHINAPWLENCAIGVRWENLQQFDTVIAVAIGKRKAPAVLGALRSGIVDILITDDLTAEEMLNLAGVEAPAQSKG
jgi:DNA-binding transcriptional regulator LsrR (DeoR family)